MSISVDNATSQINFGQLESMNNAAKAKEVGGGETAILSGDGLTVTERSSTVVGSTSEAQGAERSEKLKESVQVLLQNAEEIDGLVDDLKLLAEQLGETVPPAGTPIPKLDLESIQAAVNAFNSATGTSIGSATVNTLATAAAGGTTGATSTTTTESASDEVVASTKYSTGDVMFSIYEMISLLQEVGQSERDAAREMREAELSAELASINLQANIQREGAMWGLVTTIVTCCIQVGTTIASAGVGASKNAPDSSGKIDLEQNENTVNTMKAAAEGNAAQNTKGIEGKTSAANKNAVEANWDKCGCNEAKAKYETACKEEPAKIASLEGQKATIDKALADLDDMDTSKMSSSEIRAYLDTKNSLKAQSAAKTGEIEAVHQNTEAAKAEYKASIHKAMDGQQAEYNKVSNSAKGAETKAIDEKKTSSHAQNKQNASDTKAALSNQKDAGEQRTLMEAKGYEALAELGEVPTEPQIENAQMQYSKTEAGLKFDKGHQAVNKGLNNQMKGQIIGQMTQIVGQIGQAMSQSINATYSSMSTVESANQKEMDARREETNDMFKQAGDLINSARQLLQSVIQSESQSVQQIINA